MQRHAVDLERVVILTKSPMMKTNTLSRLNTQHISMGAALVLMASLYWGLLPSWSAWQGTQRQNQAAQAENDKAQRDLADLQQRYAKSPVDVESVSATLARLIELSHISPARHGVTVSQMTPTGAGRSSTGTVAIERLVQTDAPTGLSTLGLQVKGQYTSLEGLYSFIDALGPKSGMAVQSFEAAGQHFVLTVQAYASDRVAQAKP